MSNRFDISRFNFPEVFIVNAKVAYDIINKAVLSHQKYWDTVESIEEHLKGRKPMPPEILKKKGLDWVNNWNYGKARSKIEQIVAEGVSLATNSLAIATPTFRRFKEGDEESALMIMLDEPNTRGVLSNKIAKVFADTLENEPRFPSYINQSEYFSNTFGYAAITHDNFDWLGHVNHPLNIAFEDRSKPSDIPTWILFDVIKADKLYRLWIKEKQKEAVRIARTDSDEPSKVTEEGWYVKGIEEALYTAFKRNEGVEDKDVKIAEWEDVLSYYSKIGWTVTDIVQNTHNVKVAKIFRREFDGRISETYVTYNNKYARRVSNNTTPSADAPTWTSEHLLYQKVRKQTTDERINLIREGGFTQNGYIQEHRGIGRLAVEDSIRYNRKRNSVENKLLVLGQPMFQQPTTQNGEPFKIGVSQGFTLLSSGYIPLEKQFTFDLRQHLLSLQFDEGEYARDTVQYDAKLEGRLSSRPNKDEIKEKLREVSGPKRSKNQIKVKDYSLLYLQIFRNLSKLKSKIKEHDPGYRGIQYFFDELKYEFRDLTTDESEIKKLLDAVNDFAIDPAIDDPESIYQALRIADDPYQINRLERMLFLAIGFSRREVDRLRPLITEQAGQNNDTWIAATENDMFWTTREIVHLDSHNPVVHLDNHFGKLGRVIQNVGQGEDPVKAIVFTANCLDHAKKHLERMTRHPFFVRYFQKYSQLWRQFNQQVPELERIARETLKAKQEGKQQQQSPEMVKALNDIQLKNLQAQKKEERTDYLTEVKRKQGEEQAAFKNRLKEQEHQAKLARDAEMAEMQQQIDVMRESVKLLTQ